MSSKVRLCSLCLSLLRVWKADICLVHLANGLKQDRDDAILLHYARVPDDFDPNSDEDAEGEDEQDDGDGDHDMDFGANANVGTSQIYNRNWTRPVTPPSPSSPFKRARTLGWDPPEHVPDFLPPFPKITPQSDSSPGPPSPPPIPAPGSMSQPLMASLEAPKGDIIPTPANVTSASAAASDFLVQVPYSQSSLSSVSEWHLPNVAPPPPTPPPRLAGTPQTEPSLLAAYHHILTHPPSSNVNLGNPSRHKVAMALLSLTQGSSRWEPPDTLSSNLMPNLPRALAGPTFPVPINAADAVAGVKLPMNAPRSVASDDRITQVVSQQSSRIPELARFVLPVSAFHSVLCM